jgi:hypothetical protein
MSAFAGGLWIIPVGLFLAAIWSFYRGIKQYQSGSGGYVNDKNGVPRWVESDEKVGFFTIGAVWFGIIFLAASIGSAIWMYLEK